MPFGFKLSQRLARIYAKVFLTSAAALGVTPTHPSR